MFKNLVFQIKTFASHLNINIVCRKNIVRIINIKLKDYIDVLIRIFERVSFTFLFNCESIINEY